MFLYNLWQKTFLPEIDDELDAHLSEAMDFYLEQGVDKKEAHKKALADFGDRSLVIKQLLKENISSYYNFLATISFLLCGVIFIAGFIFSHSDFLINAFFLKFIYIWAIFALMLIGLYYVKFINNFWGAFKNKTLLAIFSFIFIYNFIIVVFYDIDAIEIIMQNTLLLTPLLALAFIGKKYSKQYLFRLEKIIFVIITLCTVAQKSVLSSLGSIKCLFITPDKLSSGASSFSSCQQLSFFSWNLLPFWLIAGASIGMLLFFLFNYLKSKQNIINKIFIGLTSTAMIVCPIFLFDSNNYHKVEIINWQPEIIQAYRDILGRDPEEKDMAFYAEHETYLYMDRIKDTLYQSQEREIKINLIYQKILKRSPSEEELSRYIENRMSIKEIRNELRNL
ncbi:MAG: permease prefix domain 1-containing protein [Patescibacteria group bacterium]|jgi:hypothetical protein